MAQVALCIDAWLGQREDYQALLSRMGLESPTILWADDIAIPLATTSASALVPFLQDTLAVVRDQLHDLGFMLSMAKGKTSAVLTFKGPQAADLRKRYQLHANPGVQCTFSDGSAAWLHFVSCYKHLGTIFASKHDLMCELRTRVGLAKSAFAQISRPILTNRNLPIHLRLQFFNSLIATKLFFGLGSWPTPSPKQLQYLQSALVGMLRKVLRLCHSFMPADQVLTLGKFGDVRARLAVDRLLYAQRLHRTGPYFLHHLLQREYECDPASWLHGRQADLAWLDQVTPGVLPTGWQHDLTDLYALWPDPAFPWPRLVKKAWKLHLCQNAIIADAKMLHSRIFKNLREAGATFNNDSVDPEILDTSFDCFCGKQFMTKRGLLAHQRKTHRIFSVERKFLQGCTCLHCGKFLWTTQRLQQHLAYIPKGLGYNPCFAALSAQERVVDYDRVDHGASSSFVGLHRREALQVQGLPVDPCTPQDARRAVILEELDRCFDRLSIKHQPVDPELASVGLGDQLTYVTLQWFYQHYPHGPSDIERQLLADAWIQVLCDFAFANDATTELDPWIEMIFLAWGEHWLPDVLGGLEHGVAEADIDVLFADFAAELERFQLLARVAHLEHSLQYCAPTPPVGHRPLQSDRLFKHPKVSSKVHLAVPRAFAQQTEWQQALRCLHFFDLPRECATPKLVLADGSCAYLVIHLFSGRRRCYDVHQHLHELCRSRGISLIILSLDTAISNEYGNLMLGTHSWAQVERIYATGLVAGTLIGSPCETFSEARFTPQPESDQGRRWPRPLRSAARLFGLEGLTLKELQQCRVGSNFFPTRCWSVERASPSWRLLCFRASCSAA